MSTSLRFLRAAVACKMSCIIASISALCALEMAILRGQVSVQEQSAVAARVSRLSPECIVYANASDAARSRARSGPAASSLLVLAPLTTGSLCLALCREIELNVQRPPSP